MKKHKKPIEPKQKINDLAVRHYIHTLRYFRHRWGKGYWDRVRICGLVMFHD